MEEKNIVWLLKQLNLLVEQYAREHMRVRNITLAQWYMLNFLLLEDGNEIFATDIHLKFGISKASVSTVLKGMKQQGYLEMVGDPRDDRRKKLILTEKAYSVREEVREDIRKQEESLCRGLSEEQREQLREYLGIMTVNLKSEHTRRHEHG